MTINEAVKNKYLLFFEQEQPIGVIQRFNIIRATKPNQNYIFVEGSTDKIFYEATNDSHLSINAEYFYSRKSDYIADDEKSILGKESVLYCYNFIKNEKSFNMNTCTFIVDRDYDAKLQLIKIPLSNSDKKNLCMTKGHSFENYFLDEVNLKYVFSELGLSDQDLSAFLQRFTKFLESTKSFFSAKAVITEAYSKLHLHYKKKHDDNEVFSADIKNNNGINSIILKEENSNQKLFIQSNRLEARLKYYENILGQNLALYIRGHNVFEYLQAYLQCYHRMNLSSRNRKIYSDIVKHFQVEFK